MVPVKYIGAFGGKQLDHYQCECVQKMNRLMKAIESEDAPSVLIYLKKMGNGCGSKLDDVVLGSAYQVIMRSADEGLIEELKESTMYRQDIFQKISQEDRRG